MDRNRKGYLILQILFLTLQPLKTTSQHSIKQYLHVTGVGPHSQAAGLATLPTVGITRHPAPGQVLQPSTGLGGISALALPGLIQALTASTALKQTPQIQGVPTLKTQPIPVPIQTVPSVPTAKQNTIATNTASGGLDSNVLNNLAIALQLLIVSNILNSNLPENGENPIYEILETVKNIPIPVAPTKNSNAEVEMEFKMPNANYVGSSGFLDHSVSDPYVKSPTTRNSFQLMSPYEALGPNSPFSDPILSSPYGSVISSKKGFQSPYSMMQDSEPFSMSDIF